MAEARKTHDFSEPHHPEPIGWNEADQLIRSMSTPAVPETKYHVPAEKLATMNEMMVEFVPAGQPSPHECTTRRVLATASNGSLAIEAYSVKHIKPIREKMDTSLKRAGGE